MSKTLRIRIFSFVLAAVLSFFGTAYSVSLIASAASFTSWDDVGADAIALKNAYVEYVKSFGSGDIGEVIGKGVDIPISWLKTLSDGALAISPVDDLYYYLYNGVLQYDDNREHRSGGGGGRRRGEAKEIQPDITAEYAKKVKDYWSDYYKPHENAQQFVWSYQTRGCTSAAPYCLSTDVPVYLDDGSGWGGKQWSGIYVLPFLKDDDGSSTFYGKNYGHFSSHRDEDGNLYLDYEVLVLSTGDSVFLGNKAIKNSWSWNTKTQKFIVYNFSDTGNALVRSYSDYVDYVNSINSSRIINWAVAAISNMVSFDFSQNDVPIKTLWGNVSFTPDTNKNDDWGFICSSEPFQLYGTQTSIDYNKIPDNYTITINGDNIYNYPITDPTNGKSATINNYITNNYILGDDSGGGSGGDTTNNVWNIDFPDFITNITTSIETAITNVFVADVDVINNYNSELQDTFNKKLPFVNDFGDIFKSLFVDIVDNNFVYAGDIKPSYSSPGSEPDSGGTAEASGSSGSVREESIIYPKWTIDLSFFGKEMELTILDFSMYAEPLSYVRLIVCVFIYAVYFVNLMKYLPTLIGGVIDMGTGVYSTVNPPKKEKGGD